MAAAVAAAACGAADRTVDFCDFKEALAELESKAEGGGTEEGLKADKESISVGDDAPKKLTAKQLRLLERERAEAEALAAVKEGGGGGAAGGAGGAAATAASSKPAPLTPTLRMLACLLVRCHDVVPWSIGDRSGVGFVAVVTRELSDEIKALHVAYNAFLEATGLFHEGTMFLPLESEEEPGKTDEKRQLCVSMTSGDTVLINDWLKQLDVPPITSRIVKSAYAEDAPRLRDMAAGGAGKRLPAVEELVT